MCRPQPQSYRRILILVGRTDLSSAFDDLHLTLVTSAFEDELGTGHLFRSISLIHYLQASAEPTLKLQIATGNQKTFDFLQESDINLGTCTIVKLSEVGDLFNHYVIVDCLDPSTEATRLFKKLRVRSEHTLVLDSTKEWSNFQKQPERLTVLRGGYPHFRLAHFPISLSVSEAIPPPRRQRGHDEEAIALYFGGDSKLYTTSLVSPVLEALRSATKNSDESSLLQTEVILPPASRGTDHNNALTAYGFKKIRIANSFDEFLNSVIERQPILIASPSLFSFALILRGYSRIHLHPVHSHQFELSRILRQYENCRLIPKGSLVPWFSFMTAKADPYYGQMGILWKKFSIPDNVDFPQIDAEKLVQITSQIVSFYQQSTDLKVVAEIFLPKCLKWDALKIESEYSRNTLIKKVLFIYSCDLFADPVRDDDVIIKAVCPSEVARVQGLYKSGFLFKTDFIDCGPISDVIASDWIENAAKGIFEDGLYEIAIQGVGYGVFSYSARDVVARIGIFSVSPHIRGSGRGAMIFDAALGYLFEMGFKNIEISCFSTNIAARKIYSKPNSLCETLMNRSVLVEQ